MVMPETIPGTDSGRVTRKNTVALFAPRSDAASKRDLSSFNSEVYKGKIMNGRKS